MEIPRCSWGDQGQKVKAGGPSVPHPFATPVLLPPKKKNLSNDESPAKQSAQRRLRVPVGGSRAAVAGGLPLYKRGPEQEQEAEVRPPGSRRGSGGGRSLRRRRGPGGRRRRASDPAGRVRWSWCWCRRRPTSSAVSARSKHGIGLGFNLSDSL